MKGFEPIFIDSVSFIYLVENHPTFASKISDFFITESILKENSLITSVITISEFCVIPYRKNDYDLIQDFQNVIETFHISVIDINNQIASTAARLRAKYFSLKTADALQLATAINFGCSKFITNDIALKKISELNVFLINDL